MKKSILVLTTILLIACHKETSRPAASPSTTNSNTTPVANSTLSVWEQPLVGNWKMTKHYSYSANTVMITDTYTNTVDCHLQLDTAAHPNAYLGGSYARGKKAVISLNCQPTLGFWSVSDSVILSLTGSEFRIQKITADSLVLTTGRSVSSYSQKYILWK